MNVSAVASAALEQIIEELGKSTDTTNASTSASSASSTGAVWSSSSSSSSADGTPNSTTTEKVVTEGLVNLLKSLASGNAVTSRASLTKLAADIYSTEQTSSSTTLSNSSSSLNNAIKSISEALNSGSTSNALANLASYLVKAGQNTGNLVDISA